MVKMATQAIMTDAGAAKDRCYQKQCDESGEEKMLRLQVIY